MQGTTWTGIIQLIMAGISAFTQIWGTVHGAPVDPLHSMMTVGLAAGGVNGVQSQAKQ